ncbi:PIR protein [Plasmodium yoelii yoelii]|uniref:PIR protein n=1 Tax=Plasmodium yoelii yoelii TaxID=73239 RepID=A0AAE9WT28_PLAYO|nr:PIR protein [Plasmodium yoelii yoelii]
MTINNVCNEFKNLWNYFHDESNDSGEYHFKDLVFKTYCPDLKCNNDIDKINAGCLWIFNAFFGKISISLNNVSYKDAVVCIMMWLSYRLSLNTFDDITTLNDFYSKHIEKNEKYAVNKMHNQKFKGYKDIIDQIKEYMDIDVSHMSKFYELLKLLCSMDTAYTRNDSSDFSKYVKKFVEEYEKLLDDDNNTDGSPYNKVLLVLSNYYYNFEKLRVPSKTQMERPSLRIEKRGKKVELKDSEEIRTTELSTETDRSSIETTTTMSNTTLSGSSVVNKLVIVLSIFSAILIFFGIAYKYSLFGFRKRSQKQKLKEKIKT